MQKHLSTYIKGLDRDTSKIKYSNDKYYNAENLRLTSVDGLSNYTLTNADGNLFNLNLDQTSFIPHIPYIISGYTFIREKLVLLLVLQNKTNITDATDKIVTYDIGSDGLLTNKDIKYTGVLELDVNNPVKRVIGRYETANIQKIYWTNGITSPKYCNIADSTIYSYPTERFNIYPKADIGTITINNVGSGALKSGVVQYAYQLYNLYGAQTSIVNLSNLVPLSESNPNTLPDTQFKGSVENIDANRSVTFTITNSDTDFNRIKVYRVQYFNYLSSPTITTIADTVNTSSITITDTGTTNLGELTEDEFNFINYRFIPKDYGVKNNYLFAANITEQFYNVNWDARAYRFASASHPGGSAYQRKAYLRSGSFTGTPLILSGNIPSGWTSVPATHDCINSYNNISSTSINDKFIYKANGVTIGAEGTNVVIGIAFKGTILDDNITNVQTSTSGSSRNSNPLAADENSLYQYDEIYSFAIHLINNKGQETPAKWVCDFRMPTIDPLYASYLVNNQLIGSSPYPVFTVKNLPSDCIGYRIVRCERKEDDRTILAQGIVGTTVRSTKDTDSNLRRPSTTLVSIKEYKQNTFHLKSSGGFPTSFNYQTIDRSLLDMTSPEISFNKNLTFSGGDFLQLIGIGIIDSEFRKTSYNGAFTRLTTFTDEYNNTFGIWVKKISEVRNCPEERLTINNSYLVESVPNYTSALSNTVTVGTKTFINISKNYPLNTDNWGRGSTKLLIDVTGNFTMSSVSDTIGYGTKVMYCNYRRPIIPYGGNTYDARAQRTYIACSRVFTSSELTNNIYGGDTYTSYFESMRTLNLGMDGELVRNENFVEAVRFPVQSSINIKWRTADTYNNILSSTNGFLIQEQAGKHTKSNPASSGFPAGGLSYEQPYDLYAYNSVYSVGQKVRKYYPLNPLHNFNKEFDCRVQYSERKFNSESIDSWTIWKPLNFKDVDNQYGSITAILNYNTKLMVWQPGGVTTLAVEEREALPSSGNTGALTIGTGGILSRYDYISTACGSRHLNSILPCRNGVYWYDNDNNAFFVYEPTGNIDNVTKLSGVQSWLYTNLNNTHPVRDVITGYDAKFNEVLFTVIPQSSWVQGQQTIAYNEMFKVFTGFYTCLPKNYLQHTKYLYSTANGNALYLHSHDTAGKGSWHGNIYPSVLELIINPNGDTIDRFDILEWLTEAVSTQYPTFTTIRLLNDYQDSGTITLNSTNLVRRFRTWRFNQMRSNTGERLKDSHLHVVFTYTNTTTRDLVIHDIITTYSTIAPH